MRPLTTVSAAPSPFSALHAVFADDMRAVDDCLRAHLSSEAPLVNQVTHHIIKNRGKRVRPLLLLMTARVCQYTGTHHHTLAAAIELIHTATLLHDDVVDGSERRRGQRTANAVFGNAAAVLVGDFLYSRSFQMMVRVQRMDVQAILADATNLIAQGEVLQLMHIGDIQTDAAAYLQVVQYKTAKLFEAAAQLGAALAKAPTAIEHNLARFGMHVGTAFQIIDDVLDYTGDAQVLGKNIGADLSEGKLTLPIIYALENASAATRDTLKASITQQNTAAIPDLLHLIKSSDAIARARRTAESEVAAALSTLTDLPASPTRDHLITLAQLAVGRDH